jgi:lactate permease
MFQVLSALLPFTLLFFLMVVFKKPAFISAPITLAVTILAIFTVWQMDTLWFGVALIKGLFVTIDIIYIVFGALILLFILQKANLFASVKYVIEDISQDDRIQAILVGWFFVSLIEGVAGFGTPAMLAAPVLVAVGLSPINAVIIALVGNSVAVTFGAVGVPINIGIVEGLTPGQTDAIGNFLPAVVSTAAFINLVIGSFIPLAISCLTTYLTVGSIRKGLEIAKYAIFAGFCFTLPYTFIAFTMGPEFPSILGSIIGFTAVVIATKLDFLTPQRAWRFSRAQPYEETETQEKRHFLRAINIFLPYIILVLLLGISRVANLGIGNVLKNGSVFIGSILGTGVNHSFDLFYSPGFFLLVVSLLFIFIHKLSIQEVKEVLQNSFSKIFRPFITLLFILIIVNILLYSGNNNAGLPSIPVFLAQKLSVAGVIWPVAAPVIGMIGAFITGSSTVSNLLFSSLQAETAILFGYSPWLILALQAVGSSVGNMFAIHNVIAALAVVGIANQESKVIRTTFLIAISYALLAGILGLLLSTVLKN